MKFFDKYYHTLGVPAGVSDDEIKKAYRKMAKQFHPDRTGDESTREKFIQVNEAYEILMRKDKYVQEAILRYQKKNGMDTEPKPHRDPAYKPKQQSDTNVNHRARAEAYADMRFKDFEKTPIYRTAVAFNSFFDYFLVVVGIMMVISPIIEYFKLIDRDPALGDRDFQFLPLVLGIAFLIGVRYFIFKSD